MKVDLQVPSSLSEISLSRYQKFVKMKDSSNDEEFIAQKMIQIFCGIKLADVAKIKMKDLNMLINHFEGVFSEKPSLVPRFKIKHIEFGFIPKLDDITFGEYVDLENYLKNWETHHKAMAIMYRPINQELNGKYSIVEYEPNEEMQELMKYAPLNIALGASLFFWNLANELANHTLSYLEKQLKTMTEPSSTAKGIYSASNGDGIAASMRSLREMLPSSTELLSSDLLNVSPISYSKSKKTKSKQMNLNNK